MPQQNIGADLIQEARVIERQKVLNGVHELVDSTVRANYRILERFNGEDVNKKIAEMRFSLLRALRSFEADR